MYSIRLASARRCQRFMPVAVGSWFAIVAVVEAFFYCLLLYTVHSSTQLINLVHCFSTYSKLMEAGVLLLLLLLCLMQVCARSCSNQDSLVSIDHSNKLTYYSKRIKQTVCPNERCRFSSLAKNLPGSKASKGHKSCRAWIVEDA